jgi:hypothetical protein
LRERAAHWFRQIGEFTAMSRETEEAIADRAGDEDAVTWSDSA